MAPSVSLCRARLPTQPLVEALEKPVYTDTWLCQPMRSPVSSPSSSGSSCTTQKTSVALDASPKQEEEEPEVLSRRASVCATPKSKKHRIPVVDVDLCPPAPKKARARGAGRLLSAACSTERDSSSNFLKKLSFSPSYLF